MFAVESSIGPHFAFFWVEHWSAFSFFPCFSKLSFSLQKEETIEIKQRRSKLTTSLSQNLVQFCCATCVDQFLTQAWTNFWLMIFSFWTILGYFSNLFLVFSAKNAFLKPTPKNRNTICEHNGATWKINLSLFSELVFLFLPCLVFGCLFWEEWKNDIQNKTTKTNKTTRRKQENHLVLLQRKKADNTDLKQYNFIVWTASKRTQESKQDKKNRNHKIIFVHFPIRAGHPCAKKQANIKKGKSKTKRKTEETTEK